MIYKNQAMHIGIVYVYVHACVCWDECMKEDVFIFLSLTGFI